MRAIPLLSLLLLASLPLPANSQPVSAEGAISTANKRTRTVVVYGNDPCPKATNPDEIVVCARRPEEERFRIPEATRTPNKGDRSTRSVAEERNALIDFTPGGTGTCTPVGPGGETGCTMKAIQNSGRRVRDVVRQAGEPSAAPKQ